MSRLPTGTVTFLLTDVEGSTKSWESDAHKMRASMKRHHEILHRAVEQAGGIRPEEQGEGDSVVAAFSRASDAIACAVEIQSALYQEPWKDSVPVRVRIGIHTGEIELRDDNNYYGTTINRCARLRGIAHGGQILMSQATEQLVARSLPEGSYLKDLGPHRMKDLSEPERVIQLCHPNFPCDFPAPLSMETLPNNLPIQLTSFVGREHEMRDVAKLLSHFRLVTLSGAAGCGKTRLALQVAADVMDVYDDGAWFVDLAPLADPALVAHTTAGALSLQEDSRRPILEALIDYLRDRALLLILDNCEHLLSACTDLASSLLRSCPRLVVLATSREPLGVAGETSWRVPSLAIPTREEAQVIDDLIQAESARLFIERATAVSADFHLTQEEATAIGQICRRLDGIPLAIELAAAHTDVLTCEQIASMLDDQFRILTGGARTALERQQTMRAAVEWSYELLADSERSLLNRLSVFVGGFSLEAAEEVCSGGLFESIEVLPLLSSLIRKSLVIVEKGAHASRYRLLETIRQYARDRLRESGEAPRVRTLHRDWFLAFAEKVRPGLWEGGDQPKLIASLEQEHDNLRAALEWSSSDEDLMPMARLATALWRFWDVRGYAVEGRRWLTQSLEREGRMDPAVRGRALSGAAWLAFKQSDLRTATAQVEEAVALLRDSDDERSLAEALNAWAVTKTSTGDLDGAHPIYEESLRIRQKIGDRRGTAAVLSNLANIFYLRGDVEGTEKAFQEVLNITREVGDRHNEALVLWGLATLGENAGSYEQARAYAEKALEIARELGATQLIGQSLGLLGILAFVRGDYDSARTYWTEGADVARESDQIWGETITRAHLAYINGNYAESKNLADEGASFSRDSGEIVSLIFSLQLGADAAEALDDLDASNQYIQEGLRVAGVEARQIAFLWRQGRISWLKGDYQEAVVLLRKSIPLARQFQDRHEVVFGLENLAAAEAGLGNYERAARLYGAAEQLRETLRSVMPPHMVPAYRESISTLRAAAGDEVFEKSWAEGRNMSEAEAIDYSLA